ncbi:nuclear condensin complex subunit Smc4 [Beauveria brongniartii RCEF 3172]|uniref:Nuclear condensin complex subunit Smc4 n=1 Tax=Beauveria brongniartii RCEF 3172 TaxID=1081107 RepID=A0A162M4V8_9HYPO|nr:nuclear condensin complex subunit Smc4 [Beauveria brongniartii RCEF 3172]
MWCALLFLFAAFSVAAFPAANEYGECEDDDLYDSLKRDGEDFCNELLDPECYTSISTPVEYTTYDDWKLSSYCSCVYDDPCHHDTTSSDIGTLPSYTRSTYTTTTTMETTSETQITSTTAVPVKTTSTQVSNTTSRTSSGPRITSATILPGNRTSTQWSNTTAPTPSDTKITSATVLPGNMTSTRWFNTTTPTPSETEISSTTILSGNRTSTQWLNTTMPTSSETGVTSTTIVSENTTIQAPTTLSRTPSSPLPVTTFPGSITSTQVSNITSPTPTPTPTPFYAANFTSVLRGPAPSSQACHYRPAARDGLAHLATLQNEEIRQRNLSLAFPYVGSINFDSDDLTPLYLSVRDAAKGAHLIDVSDSSAVTIFDSRNNSMRLDLSGIHFVTSHCNLTVSYLIDNLYGQLAQQSFEMCSMGRKKLLAGEQTFVQTLVLRDQCGNPVGPTVRRYPDLRVDGEQCIALVATAADPANGTWTFDCPWQSAGSAVQRCMSSLERNAVEFLLYDPFNGGCADASSVVTMLEASARDMLNITAIRQELHSQVGNNTDHIYKVDDIVMYYMQLWETLKSTLSKTRGLNPGRGSNLKQYLDTYNRFRNFAADACTSLNSSIVPAVLSLSAGSSTIPRLASFPSIPVASEPLTVKIQDPSKMACCPNGSMSVTNPENGKCGYPAEARVLGTGCVCGKTATQESVAFKYRQCDNFVSQCQADSDCATAGYAGFLCLIGSCCGKGVCFDPFECSRAEVLLLPGSAD